MTTGGSPENVPVEIEISYIQADSSFVQSIPERKYTSSDTSTFLNNAIPNNVITYDNYQDALLAIDNPTFIKSIVNRQCVGFIYQNKLYYLSNVEDEDYEYDKAVLTATFGAGQCHEYNDYYSCIDCNSMFSGAVSKIDHGNLVGIYNSKTSGTGCTVNFEYNLAFCGSQSFEVDEPLCSN